MEAAKMHVLSILLQRKDTPEKYLTNTDIRKITGLNRDQVKRLMREFIELTKLHMMAIVGQ
jgi:hypothetical protein